MYGAKEVVRNSLKLVEAAFDGELDEIIEWIDKGFSIDSVDARKHSALSEAACQGHIETVRYLVEQGSNPNLLNDVGRSALWRASFGGHHEVVEFLLNSGADPTYRDKVSMDCPIDVAKTDEVKDLLVSFELFLRCTSLYLIVCLCYRQHGM